MSKVLRLFTVSLLLASIMITAVAGGVLAHDQDRVCDPEGPATRNEYGPAYGL